MVMRAIIFMLSLILVIACQGSTSEKIVTSDEYAIYQLILDTVYCHESRYWGSSVSTEKPRFVVVWDSTSAGIHENVDQHMTPLVSSDPAEVRRRSATHFANIVPEVDWMSLFESFDQVKRMHCPLVKSSFARSDSIVLLSNQTASRIFAGGGWEKFYETFPGCNGHISFSRVGFSRTSTEALAYYEHICAQLDGEGSLVVFKKIDGAWKLIKIIPGMKV